MKEPIVDDIVDAGQTLSAHRSGEGITIERFHLTFRAAVAGSGAAFARPRSRRKNWLDSRPDPADAGSG
ncbi:hypothetical protein EAO72_17975 [Streptomyces sp. or43]|nr:hypothetical protein EAO72_17975 [Streptomyces sp. or43]